MVEKGKQDMSISDVKFSPMQISEDVDPSKEEKDGDFMFQRSLVREDSGVDELCGVGSWRPGCFQKLANRRIYAIAFATVIIIQGMTYSYFYGVLTTVEKTFGIQSRTFGFILSGNDISQILCGVLVTYIAGRGSRPFWLAMGLMVTSCSCLLYASAQFFWSGDSANMLSGLSAHSHLNDSGHVLCSKGPNTSLEAEQWDTCENSSTGSSTPALIIFFIGQVISGMGSLAIFSLGFTYMDDNVKMSASPLYTTFTTGLRYLGPTLGYTLASVCLKIYIQPSEIPDYDQKNPRWLGAWWLGFIIVGLTQMIIAVPIILFPKQLPATRTKILASVESDDSLKKQELGKEIGNNQPSLKDFLKAIRRILRNPIVVLELLSTGPLLLGIVGFSTFLPKYLESNFGKTPAQATVFTGVSGMCMMMVGSIAGGLSIWKFKPRAVTVCIWCLIVDIIYVTGIFIIMNFKCNSVSFAGADFSSGELKILSECAQDCQCTSKFEPVCMGSQQYLSPCFAGCNDFDITDDGQKIFFNCTCGMSSTLLNGTMADLNLTMQTAQTGYCPGSRDCDYFWPYIVILGIVKMMAATSRVGGLLVFIRSVDKQDKSITISLMGTATSILGFIPGPIVYGAVVDSTCLLWETSECGSKKNCWLYDLDDFRHYFHGITMACFTLAIVFDVVIAMYARKLNLYSESPPSRVLGFVEGLKCNTESQSSTENFSPLKSNTESQSQLTENLTKDVCESQ